MSLEQRCQKIELILSDVDGVMTDGSLVIDNQAVETKRFHARDGLGVKLWQRAGYRFGMITARSSQIVKLRAAELDVEIARQGVGDKRKTVEEILADLGLSPEAVCYIGDDLPDLPALGCAGFGVAVADACEELRRAADYVTDRPGGAGAVREVVETILKAQRRWEEVIRSYQ